MKWTIPIYSSLNVRYFIGFCNWIVNYSAIFFKQCERPTWLKLTVQSLSYDQVSIRFCHENVLCLSFFKISKTNGLQIVICCPFLFDPIQCVAMLNQVNES